MFLWHRKWHLEVGEIATGDLDISFEITKSLAREPNTASIRIWNLHAEHRAEIERAVELRVSLSAGYEDGQMLLFVGDVRCASSRRSQKKIKTVREATDWITEIEAEDSGRTWTAATIQRSWRANTSNVEILRACLDVMQVGQGNVAELPVSSCLGSQILSGPVWLEVERIVRAAGCTWTIQDGTFELRRDGQLLQATAVNLTTKTGLLEAPVADVDGTFSATALLIPGLSPGQIITVNRENYSIYRATYVGNTAGSDWYCRMVLRSY